MIKIKSSALKEFLKRGRVVKPSNILPILKNIKLECSGESATLTKTNLNSYCVHSVDAEFSDNVTLLIDERKLNSILISDRAEFITISYEGDKVILSDGNSEVYAEMEKADDFPSIPANEDLPVKSTIQKDVIESIIAAKNYVKTDDDNHPGAFVHIQNGNEVFATNGFIVYFKKFNYELPDLLLYPDMCNAIAGFDEVNHYRVGNYDFFETPITTYGFIRTDTKPMEYSRIVTQMKKGKGFIIDKEKVERFCELAINSSIIDEPISCIKNSEGNKLLFQVDDNKYNEGAKTEIEAEKKADITDFFFNPKIVLPAIKAVPYDYLHFTQTEKFGLILHNEYDENYSGLLMPFVKS